MSVEEIEREKVRANEPQKKVEPPKKYNAVYRQDFGEICICNVGLLTKVFNISNADARDHITNAVRMGQDVVMTGCKDMIDTKVAEANMEAEAGRCPMLGLVTFTSEPS